MSTVDLSELEGTLEEVGSLWNGKLDPVILMKEALSGESSFSPLSFFRSFLGELFETLTGQGDIVLQMVGIGYLAVFLLALYQSDQPILQDVANVAVVVVLAVPIVNTLVDMATLSQETLGQLEVFMVSSLPTLAGLSLNVGSPLFVVLAQGTALLLRHVFLPLVLVYAGLGFCEALAPNFPLDGYRRTVRSVFTWGLGITMTVFAGVTTVTGILASSTSTLGRRAARYTVGSLVPVVGSYLAEATDLVFQGANGVKNAAGVGVMAAILVLCALPFLQMFACVLLFRLSALLLQPVSSPRVNGVMQVSVEALTMIMGLTALLGVMYLLNISVFLTAIG